MRVDLSCYHVSSDCYLLVRVAHVLITEQESVVLFLTSLVVCCGPKWTLCYTCVELFIPLHCTLLDISEGLLYRFRLRHSLR